MEISHLPFVATLGLLALSVSVIGFAIRYQKKQLQNFNERQILKATFEQEIIKSQIEIYNQTLQGIAQELHDNIGQILTVVKIHLNNVEGSIQESEEKSSILQANLLVNQAIQDIRELSKSLNEDFIYDFGLSQSIAHELQRVEKTKQFKTSFIIQGDVYSLGNKREIVLFRIMQEIINNALKYSRASLLTVKLNYTNQNFSLEVSDNGVGFDLTDVQQNELKVSGSGLRNIIRRSEIIGGKCEIDSVPGNGTRISVQLVNQD